MNLLPFDGEVYYYPNFLTATESEFYFKVLQQKVKWEQPEIRLFGKVYPIPRLSAWYGELGAVYVYSGIVHVPQQWFAELEEIKRKIEFFCQCDFNAVLLNWYRDGLDSMGWHSDDEEELGLNPLIASLSLGAMRKFQLRHKKRLHVKLSLWLEGGSLLVMRGPCQHFWEHALPKQKNCYAGRINLTFRRVAVKS